MVLNFGTLTLPAIIVGAAIDSINPCAIGVLIFLMAYLLAVFKDKKRMLLGGVLYTLAVYITYFLAGVGLLTAIQNPTVAYFFYWLAAFIAFSAGTIEIKDFFWYGKGFTFQLFPGGARRLRVWSDYMKRTSKKKPKLALFLTIPIGFGAAAVELPCTGQVYLAILALLRTAPTSVWLPYLLLYNLIFIAPLIAITSLLFFGTSSKTLEKWRKKHRKFMRLGIGLFLWALGALLLWYIYFELTFGPFIRPLTFLLFATQVGLIAYVLYVGLFTNHKK